MLLLLLLSSIGVAADDTAAPTGARTGTSTDAAAAAYFDDVKVPPLYRPTTAPAFTRAITRTRKAKACAAARADGLSFPVRLTCQQ